MAAVGAAVAVATAACGSSSGGQTNAGGPSGGGRTTSSRAPSSPAPKAPPVTDPLSVDHFVAHPCDLLTKSQAKTLGATEPGDAENVGGQKGVDPICHWHDSDTLAGFAAAIVTGDENGLDDIYRANQDPDYFAYFNPTTVKGYPGVFESAVDDRTNGKCAVAFAVNERRVLDAQYTGGKETKQPCHKAKQIAADVITTIKKSS
jgi:hypothetical protein